MRGDGRVFQRGNRWAISYYAPNGQGRRVEHREPAGTEAEARKLLRARLRERAVHETGLRQFAGPRAERVMMRELFDALERDHTMRGRKALSALRSRLKRLRATFALDRALAVTADRLRAFVVDLQHQGFAPATINRHLEVVRRAFSLAVESGLLGQAPRVPRLAAPNARQGFWERAEFEAVCARLGDADVGDFVQWIYWTGMRPGEVRSLTWAAFDRESWTLRLHAKDAKTGHGRVLALEGPLREIVERRVERRRLDCPLIFHRNGRPVGEFRRRWRRACKVAGLEGKLLYDLRRTAVRNMVRANVPERVAMAISGHRTRAVFDRYNIVDERDLRQAVVRTAAYVQSLSAEPSVVPLRARQKPKAE